ncbi:MAG: DUF3382 domain-containing protein, partial [Candidatus Tectomicrobia bacterium]
MAKQALPRPNRIDIAAACKEAGLIAFVTLVLALPMAGFETVGATEGLALNFRPWFVVVPVIVMFVGRLLLVLVRGRRQPGVRRSDAESVMDRIARGMSSHAVHIAPVVLLFAIILPFMPFSNRYLIDTA